MKLIHSGRRTSASASGGRGEVLQHPLQWVVEPLMQQPSYLHRAMFGCVGCYLHGRLMLVLAARRAPWQGVLVPTAREHHAALLRDEAALVVHPILAKWLYLPESSDIFEEAARRLVERIAAADPRIGVEPGQRAKSPPSYRVEKAGFASEDERVLFRSGRRIPAREGGVLQPSSGSRVTRRSRSKRPK